MSKKILIIVDMQNGFITNEETKKVVLKIDKLLENNFFDVIVASRYHNENNIFEELLDWHEMKGDNRDIKSYGDIEDYADMIVDNYSYTCVSYAFLQKLTLLNGGACPTEVYIAGVDTDRSVLKTAVDFMENNIRPIVLTEYCASSGGAEAHKSGINCLKRLIGENQLYTSEYLDFDDYDNEFNSSSLNEHEKKIYTAGYQHGCSVSRHDCYCCKVIESTSGNARYLKGHHDGYEEGYQDGINEKLCGRQNS